MVVAVVVYPYNIFTVTNLINPNSYTNITTIVPCLVLFTVAKVALISRVVECRVIGELVTILILVPHHALAILTQFFGFDIYVGAGAPGAASASDSAFR